MRHFSKIEILAGLIIKIAPASIKVSISSMPPSLVVGGGVGGLIILGSILGFTGKSLYKKYKDGKKDPNKDQPAEPADKDQPAQPADKDQPAEPADKDQPAQPADKDQPAQPDDQKNEKVD